MSIWSLRFCAAGGRRRVSYLHLPHPNGMAVDLARKCVHIASTATRTHFRFRPLRARRGWPAPVPPEGDRLLLPTQARYLPGCLYTHDLALIGGRLHANASG